MPGYTFFFFKFRAEKKNARRGEKKNVLLLTPTDELGVLLPISPLQSKNKKRVKRERGQLVYYVSQRGLFPLPTGGGGRILSKKKGKKNTKKRRRSGFSETPNLILIRFDINWLGALPDQVMFGNFIIFTRHGR